MIYLIIIDPLDGVTRNYDIVPYMNLLGDMYPVDPPVFMMFVDGLRKPDGTPARGGYGVLEADGNTRGIIYLDSNLDWNEAVTAMIHEYAHHLSQQNHGFLMYELWREWLREEFVRRYEDANRAGNQEHDRSRVIRIGKTGCDGECKHLPDENSGS